MYSNIDYVYCLGNLEERLGKYLEERLGKYLHFINCN